MRNTDSNRRVYYHQITKKIMDTFCLYTSFVLITTTCRMMRTTWFLWCHHTLLARNTMICFSFLCRSNTTYTYPPFHSYGRNQSKKEEWVNPTFLTWHFCFQLFSFLYNTLMNYHRNGRISYTLFDTHVTYQQLITCFLIIVYTRNHLISTLIDTSFHQKMVISLSVITLYFTYLLLYLFHFSSMLLCSTSEYFSIQDRYRWKRNQNTIRIANNYLVSLLIILWIALSYTFHSIQNTLSFQPL